MTYSADDIRRSSTDLVRHIGGGGRGRGFRTVNRQNLTGEVAVVVVLVVLVVIVVVVIVVVIV
jgi:hypothetical protein